IHQHVTFLLAFFALTGFSVLLVFFFQAEDGIRDRNVTGVQTCALPILDFCRCLPSAPRRTSSTCARPTTPPAQPITAHSCSSGRSEERRVGKECRSRGAPHR